MGRFFTAVQIQNKSNDKEQFIKAFSDVMKMRGLEPCGEDDASVSYILAFSENYRWVTLTSEEYKTNAKQAHDDTKMIAENMQCGSFSVEVVDSDFAIVGLYNKTSAISDTVIVGDGSGYGFDEDSPRGKSEVWKSLIAEGKTWNELSEAINKNSVFVEENLGEFGMVLGIEPSNMVSDYEDFSGEVDKNPNVAEVYFRKRISVTVGGVGKKKDLTIKEAFHQVYGEYLEGLGYVKLKGKQPLYLKLIDNEVVASVTCKKESGEPNVPPQKSDIPLHEDHTNPNLFKFIPSFHEHFNVYCSVRTLYNEEFLMKVNAIGGASYWHNTEIYTKTNKYRCDLSYRWSISSFTYQPKNEESLLAAMEYSFEISQKHMFPALETITDFKTYITAYKSVFKSRAWENLYLRLENFHEVLEKEREENIENLKYETEIKFSGRKPERFDEDYARRNEVIDNRINKLDAIVNDRELYEKTMGEMEENKRRNLELLKKYGFNERIV